MALDFFALDVKVCRELGMLAETSRPGGRPRYERNDPDSPAYLDEAIAIAHDRWWWLIRSLLGGTDGMRLAHASTLPPMNGEDEKQYVARLRRSFLEDLFKNTIGKMVAKVAARPISWTGDVPPEVFAFAENVDGRSTSLTQFAQPIFCDGLAYGLTHILADADPDEVTSHADELHLRVRLKHIRAPDVLGYWSETINSQEVLVAIRWHQTSKTKLGRFGTAIVHEIVHMERVPLGDPKDGAPFAPSDRIRVTRYVWSHNAEAGERLDSGWEWVASEPVEFTYTDGPGLPIVTIYSSADAEFMHAEPPLWTMAEANLKHWRVASDHDNIVHHTMLPIPVLAGWQDSEKPDPYAQPGKPLVTRNAEASATYLEISGTAAEVGAKQLERIEQQAERLGAQSSARLENETATSQRMRESRATTEALRTVQAVEDGLMRAVRMAMRMVGVEVSDEVWIELNRDFRIDPGDTRGSEALRQNSDIVSKETRFLALKRADVGIPEDTTWEDERKRIKKEQDEDAANLARMNEGLVDEDEDGE